MHDESHQSLHDDAMVDRSMPSRGVFDQDGRPASMTPWASIEPEILSNTPYDEARDLHFLIRLQEANSRALAEGFLVQVVDTPEVTQEAPDSDRLDGLRSLEVYYLEHFVKPAETESATEYERQQKRVLQRYAGQLSDLLVQQYHALRQSCSLAHANELLNLLESSALCARLKSHPPVGPIYTALKELRASIVSATSADKMQR